MCVQRPSSCLCACAAGRAVQQSWFAARLPQADAQEPEQVLGLVQALFQDGTGDKQAQVRSLPACSVRAGRCQMCCQPHSSCRGGGGSSREQHPCNHARECAERPRRRQPCPAPSPACHANMPSRPEQPRPPHFALLQIRVLLKGADTVLGDAASPYELFVTDDYELAALADVASKARFALPCSASGPPPSLAHLHRPPPVCCASPSRL